MLGIIDTKTSNIASLIASLNRINLQEFSRLHSPEQLQSFENIFIPGVSSFDSCVSFLKNKGFFEALKTVQKQKIISICAGAQILFESSEEGMEQGVGLLKGRVKKIKATWSAQVPHLGWNKIVLNQDHPMSYLFDNIDLENKKFYFSHSYHFPDSKDTLAYVEYGERFPVVVAKQNIIAIQFHPEKSYNQGLQLLENLCARSC